MRIPATLLAALFAAVAAAQIREVRPPMHLLPPHDEPPTLADTRANMPEAAELSDAEVAGLYMVQMRKPAPPLVEAAPTNTIEYAIGAGMRQDLQLIGGDIHGHD